MCKKLYLSGGSVRNKETTMSPAGPRAKSCDIDQKNKRSISMEAQLPNRLMEYRESVPGQKLSRFSCCL